MEFNYVKEYEDAGIPFPKQEKAFRHTSVFTFNERLITYMKSKCPKGKQIDFVRIIDSNLREYVSGKGANLPQSKRAIVSNRIENIYRNMLKEIRNGTEIQETHLSINCPSNQHWYNFGTEIGFDKIFRNGILKYRRFAILIGKDIKTKVNMYAICNVSNAGWYDVLNWNRICAERPSIFLIEVFPNTEIPYTDPIDSPNEDFYNTIHMREEFLSKFCYAFTDGKTSIEPLKRLFGAANIDLEPIAIPKEILNPNQMLYAYTSNLESWRPFPRECGHDWDSEMSEPGYIDYLFLTSKHSYNEILNFINWAANNPNVSEINITLYRTAFRSKVVESLIQAARNGIKVHAYVELTARGDELHNLKVYEMLNAERNISVRSGVLNHKVHAKMMLIHMKDNRWHALTSTGNFNENTAKMYRDYIYITNRSDIVDYLRHEFFLIYERRSENYKNMIEEQIESLRNTLYKEIINCTETARAGGQASIVIKCNHLVDPTAIGLLNRAAEAGVSVTCVVRTTLGLKSNPDIGFKVFSVVGQYLEHDRVYMFITNDNMNVYLSSADLMFRNLYNRLETLVKVEPKPLCMEILYDVMSIISPTAQNTFVDEITPNYTLDIFS